MAVVVGPARRWPGRQLVSHSEEEAVHCYLSLAASQTLDLFLPGVFSDKLPVTGSSSSSAATSQEGLEVCSGGHYDPSPPPHPPSPPTPPPPPVSLSGANRGPPGSTHTGTSWLPFSLADPQRSHTVVGSPAASSPVTTAHSLQSCVEHVTSPAQEPRLVNKHTHL